jgi:hypothetical protein
MVCANIDNFEMSYKESLSCLKSLENSQKKGRSNCLSPVTLQVDKKKTVSVIFIVGTSSKNPKVSNMWYHYCEKKQNYFQIWTLEKGSLWGQI